MKVLIIPTSALSTVTKGLVQRLEDFSGLYRPSGKQRENKSKRKKRYVPTPGQRTEKSVEHEDHSITCCDCPTGNCHQRTGKRTEKIRKWRPKQKHSDYVIVKISQNTEKSPGYLSRLSVAQTTVK